MDNIHFQVKIQDKSGKDLIDLTNFVNAFEINQVVSDHHVFNIEIKHLSLNLSNYLHCKILFTFYNQNDNSEVNSFNGVIVHIYNRGSVYLIQGKGFTEVLDLISKNISYPNKSLSVVCDATVDEGINTSNTPYNGKVVIDKNDIQIKLSCEKDITKNYYRQKFTSFQYFQYLANYYNLSFWYDGNKLYFGDFQNFKEDSICIEKNLDYQEQSNTIFSDTCLNIQADTIDECKLRIGNLVKYNWMGLDERNEPTNFESDNFCLVNLIIKYQNQSLDFNYQTIKEQYLASFYDNQLPPPEVKEKDFPILHKAIVNAVDFDHSLVKVKFDDMGYVSGWHPVLMPYAGNNHMIKFMPEIGDHVLVGFVGGSHSKAYVLGSFFEHNNNEGSSNDNCDKIIQTPNGKKIIMNDNTHTITIEDEGGNTIILNSETNSIFIRSNNSINFGSQYVGILGSNTIQAKIGEIPTDPNQQSQPEVINLRENKDNIISLNKNYLTIQSNTSYIELDYGNNKITASAPNGSITLGEELKQSIILGGNGNDIVIENDENVNITGKCVYLNS